MTHLFTTTTKIKHNYSTTLASAFKAMHVISIHVAYAFKAMHVITIHVAYAFKAKAYGGNAAVDRQQEHCVLRLGILIFHA